MYSRFQLIKKYLSYYFAAANSKGHGTHSPFVFDFIIHVLDKKDSPASTTIIERYRQRLLRDHRKILVDDFGAGSAQLKTRERKLSDIARLSLKNKRLAALLFRIAKYYQCKSIIELGTSLGTTTAYLAAATGSRVTTLEGAARIADVAEDFFESAGLRNIQIVRGDFKDTIHQVLKANPRVDLLFVDGNHQEEATVSYFQSFLPLMHDDSIFIFDDIHWSIGMERAWEKIKAHPSVTLTIDLFFIGIVFFKKDFLVKQHFTVRY